MREPAAARRASATSAASPATVVGVRPCQRRVITAEEVPSATTGSATPSIDSVEANMASWGPERSAAGSTPTPSGWPGWAAANQPATATGSIWKVSGSQMRP